MSQLGTPFQRLTRLTLLFPLFLLLSSHSPSSPLPLFLNALNALVPSTLPQNWTTREISLSPSCRFHSLSRSPCSPLTVLLPLRFCSKQTEEGSPLEIWDSTILFHIARVCAPPRDITYEKHRNPPPARVKRLLSLCEMNSRDAYGSYDVRAYIRSVPKEFRGIRNSTRTCPAESMDENVLHKAVIPRS